MWTHVDMSRPSASPVGLAGPSESIERLSTSAANTSVSAGSQLWLARSLHAQAPGHAVCNIDHTHTQGVTWTCSCLQAAIRNQRRNKRPSFYRERENSLHPVITTAICRNYRIGLSSSWCRWPSLEGVASACVCTKGGSS